jgi:hypothetical protein
VNEAICFATFVLERADAGNIRRPEVALDLPLQWPAELVGAVELSGAARLDALIGNRRDDAR